MRKIKIGVLLGAALLCAQTVIAQSWQFVGPRAMGMGGAAVATAYGPDAQYWNPAGLTQEENVNETGVLINAGASLEASKNILEVVKSLNDMSDKYKNLQNAIQNNSGINAENLSTIFAGLNDISQLVSNKTGALVNADAGFGFKFKNLAVGMRALGTGVVRPVIDTQNVQFNTGGAGLNINATAGTATPSDPTNAISATNLANALNAQGSTFVLNLINLLGNPAGVSNAADLANLIINAVSENGASVSQISEAVNTAVENMGGAATIVNIAGAGTGSYKDNETVAMADVAAFGEAAIGYGRQIIPGVKVGGNIKVIRGYMAESGVMILSENEKFEDILDKANKNKKESTTWAVDLGALVNFSKLLKKNIPWNPQIGLTARNINGPKFERPGIPAGTSAAVAANWNNSDYKLKPQVRAGVSANPLKWMTLAADIDVTKNDTLLDNIKSRQLAVGVEFNLINKAKFNMPLRLGYNKNLAESSLCPFYTAGIGFNMVHFFMELSGAISTKTTKLDDKEIPNSAAAALTLGFLF